MEPYPNVLIGRFAFSRPPMEIIQKFCVSLGLKSSCSVGLLDSNHVFIRPSLEEDYTRFFIHGIWFVQNSLMTIVKWKFDYKANQECSIAPIWVTLPGLPLSFFNKKYLLKIGSLIGRPLQLDSAISNFKRPSVAHMLIKLDISKTSIKHIWIGDEEYG